MTAGGCDGGPAAGAWGRPASPEPSRLALWSMALRLKSGSGGCCASRVRPPGRAGPRDCTSSSPATCLSHQKSCSWFASCPSGSLRGAPRPPNDRNAAIFAAIVEPRRGVPSAMAVNSCSCPSAGVHVTSNICNSLRFGCIIASSKAHSFRAHFNPSSRSNEDRRQGLREGTTSSATSSVYICR